MYLDNLSTWWEYLAEEVGDVSDDRVSKVLDISNFCNHFHSILFPRQSQKYCRDRATGVSQKGCEDREFACL